MGRAGGAADGGAGVGEAKAGEVGEAGEAGEAPGGGGGAASSMPTFDDVWSLVSHRSVIPAVWTRAVEGAVGALVDAWAALPEGSGDSGGSVGSKGDGEGSGREAAEGGAEGGGDGGGNRTHTTCTLKELAVEVACRINSNAHAVTDPEDEAKVWGFGLFTLTSMINHSCAPNCVFVGVPDATRGGVCMQVRDREIEAETESKNTDAINKVKLLTDVSISMSSFYTLYTVHCTLHTAHDTLTLFFRLLFLCLVSLLQVRTMSPVETGGELSVSYIDLYEGRRQRQIQVRRHTLCARYSST